MSKVLENLGSDYKILRTSVKPHPCCRFTHPPIDAIIENMRENDLRAEDVEKVDVGVLRGGALLIAEPKEDKYVVSSVVDAQFSMPYARSGGDPLRQGWGWRNSTRNSSVPMTSRP